MIRDRRSRASSVSGQTDLHERVRSGLAQKFKGAQSAVILGRSEADVLVHQGNRIAVLEVKTGSPDLPLPASTTAQMLLLKEQVRQQFPSEDIEHILPVVVTNYRVTPDDQKELEEQGIKLVRIDPSASRTHDFGNFAREIADLTGLQTDLI